MALGSPSIRDSFDMRESSNMNKLRGIQQSHDCGSISNFFWPEKKIRITQFLRQTKVASNPHKMCRNPATQHPPSQKAWFSGNRYQLDHETQNKQVVPQNNYRLVRIHPPQKPGGILSIAGTGGWICHGYHPRKYSKWTWKKYDESSRPDYPGKNRYKMYKPWFIN